MVNIRIPLHLYVLCVIPIVKLVNRHPKCVNLVILLILAQESTWKIQFVWRIVKTVFMKKLKIIPALSVKTAA